MSGVKLDLDLLAKFGLLQHGNEQERDAYFTYTTAFSLAHPTFTTSNQIATAINQELQETLQLAEIAKQRARGILVAKGLAAEQYDASGEPKFTMRWNMQYMTWDLELKIAATPSAYADPDYFYYEGRTIKIKISNSASNNDFSELDVLERFDIITQSAATIGVNLPGATAKFRAQLDVEVIPLFNEFRLSTTTEERDKVLKKILKLRAHVMHEYVVELAVELIRADLNSTNYQPNSKEILRAVRKLSKAKNVYLAQQRRDILIDIHLQETADGHQHLLTTHMPTCDVPSSDRDLVKLQVPNSWDVTMHTIKLKPKSPPSIELYRQLERSSSYAHLTRGKSDRKRELATFKNAIIRVARDQIVARLNNGEEINFNEPLDIKTAYLSLLSPLVDKGMLTQAAAIIINSFSKGLAASVHKENERAQLNSLKIAYVDLQAEQRAGRFLEFTADDCNYIVRHYKPSKLNLARAELNAKRLDIEQNLRNVRIRHKCFFLNFFSNSAINFEWLAKGAYNEAGLIELNSHMSELLIKMNRRDLLEYFAEDRKLNTWEATRANLLRKVSVPDEDFMVNPNESLSPQERLGKIMFLYINILDYINKSSITPNHRLMESSNSVRKAADLAILLNFDIHIFCKSGKDRTGRIVCEISAFAAGAKKYVRNLIYALSFSNAKEISVRNGSGRSLQQEGEVYSGLRTVAGETPDDDASEVVALLNNWQSRKVGAMDKGDFACGDAITKYVGGKVAVLGESAGSLFTPARQRYRARSASGSSIEKPAHLSSEPESEDEVPARAASPQPAPAPAKIAARNPEFKPVPSGIRLPQGEVKLRSTQRPTAPDSASMRRDSSSDEEPHNLSVAQRIQRLEAHRRQAQPQTPGRHRSSSEPGSRGKNTPAGHIPQKNTPKHQSSNPPIKPMG